MTPEELKAIRDRAAREPKPFLTTVEKDRLALLDYITELTVCQWCGSKLIPTCSKCSRKEV